MIESLLQRYGLSNRWLAEKIGKTHTSVNDWLNPEGSRPRDPDMYDRMIETLQTEGPRAAQVTMRRTGLRFIPVYSTIAAGPPNASNPADVDWEEMVDWGGDFERWGRTIEGTSMSPLLIPGDIAVFEDRKYESGDVVHAYNDAEDCVKAIRGHEEDAQLWSFNDEFPPFSAAGWKAKGVCVARIRYGKYKIRQVTEFPSGMKWSMRNEEI